MMTVSFFAEDAGTPKKLSIELPSKIPLLNHTTIVVLLTETLAIIKSNCSPPEHQKPKNGAEPVYF